MPPFQFPLSKYIAKTEQNKFGAYYKPCAEIQTCDNEDRLVVEHKKQREQANPCIHTTDECHSRMMVADQPKRSTSLKSEPELPPPYTYEELYSSYQNEWDQQKTNGGTAKGGLRLRHHENDTDDTGSDNSISDLRWVTLRSNNCSNSGTYLLACTDSGEVLAWKLTNSNQSSDSACSSKEIDSAQVPSSSATIIDTGPKELLEPHSRLTVCTGKNSDDDSFDDDEGTVGTTNSSSSSVLHGMCVVNAGAVLTANEIGDGDASTQQRRGPRKRQRSNDETETTTTNANQQLLIVAGEGGLWSVPLLEVLTKHPWKPSTLPEPDSSPVVSLVRLSDRPILKLQSPQPPSIERNESGKEEPHRRWLFALEKYTNMVSMWNLSTILKCHNNENSTAGGAVAETKIDLSRCFSSAVASANRSKSRTHKRRKIREREGLNENATTILPVPCPDDGGERNGLCLLIGTDRSRLWILPIPSQADDNDEPSMIGGTVTPRYFSLDDAGNPSPPKQQPSRQGGNRRATFSKPPVWKITDILETNGSTWWTVSATRNGAADGNSGLLVTWHAPTGMVVARQETREAIQAIRRHHQQPTLYSVANEGAVSAWESSFRLARNGRFWSTPPSSKTLAISGGETIDDDDQSRNETEDNAFRKIMAVAGVGNTVDLFLDHCRVQTVRI